MVQQSDVERVANDLQTSLLQSAQAALHQQVQPGDTLITPLPCRRTSASDHRAGEEAMQVRVTVSETCTGWTYDTQAMQQYSAQIINQEAPIQHHEGYSLSEIRSEQVTHVRMIDPNTMLLQVRITSTWNYHVTDQQQQRLIKSIAGKSKDEAMVLLLHTSGIQSVAISSATLPPETQRIQLVVIDAS